MDPITLALLTSGLGIGGSALGGLFGRQKEGKYDKKKGELIDQLLASVKGQGPFSNMFNVDEAAFNKSYVEPAKQRFRDVTAPSIQQQYIESGQQRGSGIQDTLARAGVDYDQLLNQQYLNQKNMGYDRMQNTIGGILGYQPGSRNQSAGSAAMQGVGGYLGSSGFGDDITRILNSFSKPKVAADVTRPQPEGFDIEGYY